MLCEFGCGQEANYIINKNRRNCCSSSFNKCPNIRKKNSNGLIKAHELKPDVFNPPHKKLGGPASKEWRDKYPDRYKQYLSKRAETAKENYKSGKTKGSFLGRKHSIETIEKISAKSNPTSNGFIKTKYYEIFCPYISRTVKVQGTWELKFAQYLNDLKIPWVKDRKLNWKYKFHEKDYNHTYFPDFYLPASEEFVEVKGFMWKNKAGTYDDRIKLEKVQECNPNKVLIILTGEELRQLGIKV